MNKATVLALIATFDALPADQKRVGDNVIRTYLVEWVNAMQPNQYLRFSAFLMAHTGPMNFNQYVSRESYFFPFFYAWQKHNASNFRRGTTIEPDVIHWNPLDGLLASSSVMFRGPINANSNSAIPKPPSQ